MLKHQKEILDAILSAIREQYANDIALMIVYGSAVNGTADENSDLDVFYIPKTEKGCHLAKTFLWDGVGYDIWCGSWSILHSMLIWEDMRVSILADSELVYSASDAEREKYEVMRRNAAERKNLPVSAHDYHPALAFVSKAKHYFGEACIGNSAAFGGVLMELVNAVCYVNRRYLKYGTKKIAEEISAYPCLPEDFLENYRSAVREPEKAVEICKKLILATEEFVHTQFAQFTGKNKLAAWCTGLYEEIASHWNKIRRGCETNDPESVFHAACALQFDLNEAGVNLGHRFDLMNGWNPDDLPAFRCHCDSIEMAFIRVLRENGIPIQYVESPSELKQILLDTCCEDL